MAQHVEEYEQDYTAQDLERLRQRREVALNRLLGIREQLQEARKAEEAATEKIVAQVTERGGQDADAELRERRDGLRQRIADLEAAEPKADEAYRYAHFRFAMADAKTEVPDTAEELREFLKVARTAIDARNNYAEAARRLTRKVGTAETAIHGLHELDSRYKHRRSGFARGDGEVLKGLSALERRILRDAAAWGDHSTASVE